MSRKQPQSLGISKAFLIRCWQQEGEWRFILEDVATRERQVFIGVAEMVEELTIVLNPPNPENK